jgi:[NiFe] hydrogenase diaphorase moiety large subunit
MTVMQEDPVAAVCDSHGNDPTRLLDILLTVQRQQGSIEERAIDCIARKLDVPRIDVESATSFYAFLSRDKRGDIVIRLCNDVIDDMKGIGGVAAALEQELGIRVGETTPDGRITLEYTSCIGMSDQAPAALFNDLVVPRLGAGAAVRGVQLLKNTGDTANLHDVLIRDYGDGNNSHDLVRSAVHNNLRRPGPVIFADFQPGAALGKALAMSPAEVIREIKTSRLRGRGGAGFPTGMKWGFTRAAAESDRYLICNADEGEPGTFKDRVVLTERPHLVFEGMTVGGYAIGARRGIVYLRGEYAYLREFLEHVLEQRRREGLLGRGICGKQGFDFDIRIQLGAGAYICGEETALINSCEGRRGDPRNRPPFPAQHGYLGRPTSVNNVETLCCAARILEMGSGWFSSIGTSGSTGTKLLSVSGDCRRPGVYEVRFGTTLREVLKMCGAERTFGVQVGGASGQMVGSGEFDRRFCFDDLATGGSVMVFNTLRDPVGIAAKFMEFFVEESCGYCTPCRVGNLLLKERLDRLLAGRGEPGDLEYIEELAETIAATSRCGLGQTAPNPVLSTLRNFRPAYERLLRSSGSHSPRRFDLRAALSGARRLTGLVAKGSGKECT